MHHPLRRLIGVLAFEAGTVAWLAHIGRRSWLHIGWSDLRTWLRVTPTEDVLVSAIWLAAVVCTGWIAVTSLLYVAAHLSRMPALIRSVEWATLPVFRRVAERALAALLVTTATVPMPVRAQTPPPVVVVVDEDGALLPPGIAVPEATPVPPLPTLPQETSQPSRPPVPTEYTPPPLMPTDPAARKQHGEPAEVTVKPGDNLWTISARHLTAIRGNRPSNDKVAPYWRQVIERNRPSLISGNPDLIYPGEVLTMPATD